MKLYCCFTPAHKVLYENYFLPSLPDGFYVQPTQIDMEGPGDFLSREFLACIHQKLDLILHSISVNQGDVIVWSDVDIQFYDLQPAELADLAGQNDIAFQREEKKGGLVNTGFMICRCNEKVKNFFENVRLGLRENPEANEQFIINQLLMSGKAGISWTLLPARFYARTQGWPPPNKIALYHANATSGEGGVVRKIAQLEEMAFLRRHGYPALALTCIKYAPRRIFRVLNTWAHFCRGCVPRR